MVRESWTVQFDPRLSNLDFNQVKNKIEIPGSSDSVFPLISEIFKRQNAIEPYIWPKNESGSTYAIFP